MKLLLNILMLCFCLMSCENAATQNDGGQASEDTKIDTKTETKTVESVNENDDKAACAYFSDTQIRSIFGLSASAKLDIDESNNETYNQCLYYFENGYMYIIKHSNIPPPFKGDNEAFLEHIFKQYEGAGNQARPNFERLEDLDFSAGWTPDNVKVLGNTIDFVVDNVRYAIHVKFIPNDTKASKEKAIELAKIIK